MEKRGECEKEKISLDKSCSVFANRATGEFKRPVFFFFVLTCCHLSKYPSKTYGATHTHIHRHTNRKRGRNMQ